MRGRWSLSLRLCLVGFGLLSGSPAAAFVRETTGYTSATPLLRSNGCVVMAVADPRSPSVSRADLLSATTAAADSWTQAAATCGGGFRFEVAAAGADLAVSGDGVNAVVFHTSNYCNSRGAKPTCDPLSQAITWLYFVDAPGTPDDGRLFETDIEINGEAYSWGVHGDAQAGIMDLQSVLTHELGHVLGLDHNCYEAGFGLPRPVDDQGNPAPTCEGAPSATTAAIMYPVTSYGVERRTLADDDVRGVCALYRGGPAQKCEGNLTPSGGCDVGGAPPAVRWPPVMLVVVLLLRWRRRVARPSRCS